MLPTVLARSRSAGEQEALATLFANLPPENCAIVSVAGVSAVVLASTSKARGRKFSLCEARAMSRSPRQSSTLKVPG